MHMQNCHNDHDILPETVFLTPDEWPEFWDDNAEALEAEIGTEEHARTLAEGDGFYLGGGAAPLFYIRIVTPEALAGESQ